MVKMAMEYLGDDEIYQMTGVFIPEQKAIETKKLAAEYKIEQLPPETQMKAMMLIAQEIEDLFNFSDIKYDIKMKVGTDSLKQIKIQNINMLMQQSAALLQFQVVPPQVLGLLLADMADAMDRPDIAKMIVDYSPQPDPMAQAMSKIQLAKEKAQADKDAALAENALARTEHERVKAAKELDSMDVDKAKKAADVNKAYNDMDVSRAKVIADAAKNQGVAGGQ